MDPNEQSGLAAGLEGIDASSELSHLGSLQMTAPTVDIDGDGTLDTSVQTSDDSLFVMTDTNLDGLVDHLTVVDDDGDFAAWDFQPGPDGAPHWTQIDHGKVDQ